MSTFKRFAYKVKFISNNSETEWEVSTNYATASTIYFTDEDEAEAAFKKLKTCTYEEFIKFGYSN